MQTRRTFMKGTAVAATLVGPIAAHAATLAVADDRAPVALGFFDAALGRDNGFATALGANGAEAVAVGRDVTALWLRAMREHGPIIGLTRPDAVFCLQQLSPASGRVIRLHGAIPANEAAQLRAQRGEATDARLASLAFDALRPNAGAGQAGSQRAHVAALASHRSDELILWVASAAAAG